MAIELSNLTFTDKADIIPQSGTEQITNNGIANTLDGSDIITGNSDSTNFNNIGVSNYFGTINTGKGNDTITGNGGSSGYGILNLNSGTIDTGDGNDTIIATGGAAGIYNRGTINTGSGNDIITGIGTNGFGILNDSTIDTGAGNDIVDALTGGFGGTGTVNLGNGEDILKGFGSGSFNGGSGKDLLELTTGNYTIGISGTTVSFTSNGLTMNTSEFDKLIAGCATYNFTGLTDGQTIAVV